MFENETYNKIPITQHNKLASIGGLVIKNINIQ